MDTSSTTLPKRIDDALGKPDPIAALRDLVVQMRNHGMSRNAIYAEFLALHLHFQRSNRTAEADMLGDVMDMFTGWYAGRDLNL